MARWIGKLIFGLGCGLTGGLVCALLPFVWEGPLWEGATIFGFLWGMVGWIGYGLVEKRGYYQGGGRFNWLYYSLGLGLLFVVFCGLFFGLLGELAIGVLFGLSFGLLGGLLAQLINRRGRVLGYGLFFGPVNGILILLMGVLVGVTKPDVGIGRGLLEGLGVGLIGGGIAGLIGELIGRLIHPFTQRAHDGIACAQHRRRQRILRSQEYQQVPDGALSRAEGLGEPEPTDAALSRTSPEEEGPERLAASTDTSTEAEVPVER